MISRQQSIAALIGRARLAEGLTIAWMVVELVVALGAGIAAHSVALTTFGIDPSPPARGAAATTTEKRVSA